MLFAIKKYSFKEMHVEMLLQMSDILSWLKYIS